MRGPGQPLVVCGAAAAATIETGPGAGLACIGAALGTALWAEIECIDAQWDAEDARDEWEDCDREACQSGG